MSKKWMLRVLVVALLPIAFAGIAVRANWVSLTSVQFAPVEESTLRSEVAADRAITSVPEPRAITTPLNAITSFDAALISRWVVAFPPPLNADQLIVSDVTGDGTITSFDAARIANFVINDGNAGSTGTTVPPGLLMGDVSGAGPHYDGQPGTIAVSLPARNATSAVVVPVTVGDLTDLGAISYDFQVTFDPAVVQPGSPPISYTGTMSQLSTSVSWNANNPGHLIVSGWSFLPLTGSGTLLNLRFNVVGVLGQSTALTFEDYTDPGGRIHQSFLFNEGTPSVGTMTNGSVTVAAATPTSTNTSTPTATFTPSNTATATPTASPPSVTVALPNLAALPGSTVEFPIIVGNMTGQDILGYELQVTFDPAVLTPASPAFESTQTLSSEMLIAVNTNNAGHLILFAFVPCCVPPLEGAGRLIFLNFNVVGTPGQFTDLTFQNYTSPDNFVHPGFRFNEGIPVALITNGSIAVVADLTPTPTSTGTPSPTSSSTPTDTPTPSISGRVRYGNIIALPTVRNIPDVLISAAGSPPVSDLTSSDGTYVLTGFGAGSYTVVPSKSGGVNGSITSFDAARIAQSVVGLNPLNGTQSIVADVSGSNGVTSFDAGMIAKYVVGPPHTAPGIGNTATWNFSPSIITHPSVGANQIEDYSALLMGEVSGSWMPAGSQRPINRRNGPERAAFVTAPRLVTPANKEILIPIAVRGAANKDIIAYEFDLRYDPSVIQPQVDPVDLAGTVSRGLSVVVTPYEPGLLKVVVYGPMPINENGVLLNLKFNPVGSAGSVSPMTFERFMFNEGESDVRLVDGQVMLSGPAAADEMSD